MPRTKSAGTKAEKFTLTPAEFREKWAEALESGEYVQGQNTLCERTPGGLAFCCLGVACPKSAPSSSRATGAANV